MKTTLPRVILALTLGTLMLAGTASTTPVFGCGNANPGGCRKTAPPDPTPVGEEGFWAEVRSLLHSLRLLD